MALRLIVGLVLTAAAFALAGRRLAGSGIGMPLSTRIPRFHCDAPCGLFLGIRFRVKAACLAYDRALSRERGTEVDAEFLGRLGQLGSDFGGHFVGDQLDPHAR
jgi:hypothetical protein